MESPPIFKINILYIFSPKKIFFQEPIVQNWQYIIFSITDQKLLYVQWKGTKTFDIIESQQIPWFTTPFDSCKLYKVVFADSREAREAYVHFEAGLNHIFFCI